MLWQCGALVMMTQHRCFSHVPYRLFTVAIGTTVTMSGGLDVLALKEDDVTKLLAAGTHLGNANVDFQMAQYVYKTKADGKYRS